ncbi:MAG: Hsp20/alpha crystallin family protein [Thermodesulfobacteriota bacterium]|nr:Hsp20/alpha crystallin family protein [Thermodesulfobacteriota bacterium]
MITRNIFDFPTRGWEGAFSELEQLRNRLDNIWTSFRSMPYKAPAAGVFPAVNLTENRDNYYLRAELPGVTADNIDIQTANNTVTIAGERMLQQADEKARYHRRERDAGRFSRSFKLPGSINSDKIEAKLNDGILTLIIPKAEAAKPRQITIL